MHSTTESWIQEVSRNSFFEVEDGLQHAGRVQCLGFDVLLSSLQRPLSARASLLDALFRETMNGS